MDITFSIDDVLIQRIVQTIVAECDPECVILFGSRAASAFHPDSDLDLLVISQTPFGKDHSRHKEMVRIERALLSNRIAAPVDVLLYSRDEAERWKGSANHAVSHALREGKVVYARL